MFYGECAVSSHVCELVMWPDCVSSGEKVVIGSRAVRIYLYACTSTVLNTRTDRSSNAKIHNLLMHDLTYFPKNHSLICICMIDTPD